MTSKIVSSTPKDLQECVYVLIDVLSKLSKCVQNQTLKQYDTTVVNNDNKNMSSKLYRTMMTPKDWELMKQKYVNKITSEGFTPSAYYDFENNIKKNLTRLTSTIKPTELSQVQSQFNDVKPTQMKTKLNSSTFRQNVDLDNVRKTKSGTTENIFQGETFYQNPNDYNSDTVPQHKSFPLDDFDTSTIDRTQFQNQFHDSPYIDSYYTMNLKPIGEKCQQRQNKPTIQKNIINQPYRSLKCNSTTLPVPVCSPKYNDTYPNEQCVHKEIESKSQSKNPYAELGEIIFMLYDILQNIKDDANSISKQSTLKSKCPEKLLGGTPKSSSDKKICEEIRKTICPEFNWHTKNLETLKSINNNEEMTTAGTMSFLLCKVDQYISDQKYQLRQFENMIQDLKSLGQNFLNSQSTNSYNNSEISVVNQSESESNEWEVQLNKTISIISGGFHNIMTAISKFNIQSTKEQTEIKDDKTENKAVNEKNIELKFEIIRALQNIIENLQNNTKRNEPQPEKQKIEETITEASVPGTSQIN